MVRRGFLAGLVVLALVAVWAPLSAQAQVGGPDGEWNQICRRILTASGYLPPRCRALAADEAWAHFCRRVYGTDEWTRRCAEPTPTVDPVTYCRRIYGTDEWTRRCRSLADPTATTEPTRPVERTIIAEPTRPVQASVTAEPTRPSDPTRPAEPTAAPEPTRITEGRPDPAPTDRPVRP